MFNLFSAREPMGVMEFLSDLIGEEAVRPLEGVVSMFGDLAGLLLGLMEHASDELDEGLPAENFELLERAYARLHREPQIPRTLKTRAERLLREGYLMRHELALVNYCA